MKRRTLLSLMGAMLVAAVGAWCQASESETPTPADALRKNKMDLWRSSISAPRDTGKGLLTTSIADLQATSAPVRPSPTPAPLAATTAPLAPTQPAPTQVAVATSQPASQPSSAPAVAKMDPNVLENLKKAPSQGAAGLMPVADSLFGEKQYAAAYTLYEQAFKQATTDDNKSWALFQMGNCMQESDANAATALYKRLAAEFATSPWAAPAAAQAKLIDWRQSPNMQAVLEASKKAKGDGKPND